MHFVITGKINCPQFSYAVMVAQRLKENLPDFTYLKLPKKSDEWEKWLINICKANEWYHVQSPLIWREIGLKKGKKDFIEWDLTICSTTLGDINKFLDLCYDYYGIPREVLSAESFNRGEIEWFTNRTESEFFKNIKMEAKKKREYRSRQVCITGASSQVAEIVVMELFQIPLQTREDGLEIRLFDEPMKDKKLASSANDAKHCPGPSGFGNCRVANTLKEALTNVDLVIVLDSFGRKPKESLVKWLKRNRNAMCSLGKALNKYAPPHCRVIIGSPSNQPVCYNATVLASFATKLHVRNIVVVTQDLGREMLKTLSTKINVPLRDLHCPPVWGFVGLNKVIDVRKTLQTHLYKVPGKRMHSTLPQGLEEYELRTTECLLNENDTRGLHVRVSDHKAESYPQLGRWPCLAKATAILDLLRVWGLKQEDGNGEILCLGVYSDGTFNIPHGIYWSQPVILKNGFWIPFAEFPIPRSIYLNYHCLFLYSVAALYRTKIKPRRYVFPKPIMVEKVTKKFDFDKVLEEIRMPVIRTDADCVEYLKYLAKQELGIDFDVVNDTLEEESEVEIKSPIEIKRENIYCECWRQELKELQKTVFDHSSTTEVEVNLSDNISGSEWSVINPRAKDSNSIVTKDPSSLTENHLIDKTDHIRKSSILSKQSSTSMVCSCGAINGSLCHCLDQPNKEVTVETEKESTEHFYKKQNVEIFVDDLKDVIYEDTYVGEKHVSFEEDVKDDRNENDFHLNFYGVKDAIRDKKADQKRRRRILRYERGGEESIEKEEESGEKSEKDEERSFSLTEKTEENGKVKDGKFHITIEGFPYDIIGDQNGLECLDEMQRKAAENESGYSFSEMYKDEVMPALQVLPHDIDISTESSSYKSETLAGEGNLTIVSSYKDSRGVSREKSNDQISTAYLGEALDAIWDESIFQVETEKNEEMHSEKSSEEKPVKEKKGKKEGIPLCCLCRCIVPDGLTCCPCGSTTVVEVFKKESVEVFIENEDDLTFRVEYFETALPPEFSPSSTISIGDMEPEEVVMKKELPPESFFPFSPKLENKFAETLRSDELSKDYIDSIKKTHERELPEKCAELLNMAKIQLKEHFTKNFIEEEVEEEEEVEKEDDKEIIKSDSGLISELANEEDDSGTIKTNFSDLKLFIPDGIEDWRMTVQRKYREWFFQGPKIRDECYYDIAIEEVSEEEFEIDKEIEKYLED